MNGVGYSAAHNRCLLLRTMTRSKYGQLNERGGHNSHLYCEKYWIKYVDLSPNCCVMHSNYFMLHLVKEILKGTY